jgi:hypothetical protein
MDKKTLDTYNELNLYQKKCMFELLLGNDVIIWSPDSKQVDCAEDMFDVEDICLNGSSIQVTLETSFFDFHSADETVTN